MKLLFPTFNEGRSPVYDAMGDLHLVPTPKHSRKIRKEIKFLEDIPFEESLKVRRAVKLQNSGQYDLYELRIAAPSRMAYRLIFMVRIVGYIALHFFLKKSNNYDNEIRVAITRLKQYDYEQS